MKSLTSKLWSVLSMHAKLAALFSATALAVALSLGAAGSVYACGDGSCEAPPSEKAKGNNGYGQEKHGAVQDGENAGSDNGGGDPANATTKQDGTGLR
jgi:hypothetical protein